MSEAVVQTEKAVGVEVTTSAFKSVCLDTGGNLVDSNSAAMVRGDDTAPQLVALIRELLARYGGFERIGITIPGLITESEAPAGAGLAGSSTLNIACIGALNRLVGNRYAPERFIPIAAAVECQVIKVPTGYQDYYSAQYGGVSAIHFRPDGMSREALEIDVETLQKRVVVCYTGEPRNSGTNNWEITKRHIDGDKELFDIFEGIRDTSLNLREVLLGGDWEQVGEILKNAYPQRKRLSPKITTPQMDLLIENALGNGAIAAKVCGAGGGGCLFCYGPPAARSAIAAALSAGGARLLDYRIERHGLTRG